VVGGGWWVVGGGWWVVGGDAARQGACGVCADVWHVQPSVGGAARAVECASQVVERAWQEGLTSNSGAAFSRITRRYSSYLRTNGRYTLSLLLSRMVTSIAFLVLPEPICK
jgi:hypothetical protein